MKLIRGSIYRLSSFFLILILIMLLIGSGIAVAEQEQIKLKLGHAESVDGNRDRAIHYFADLVADRTENKVTIDIFPASQLGKEREMLDGIKMGTIDMGIIATGNISTHFPLYGLFDIPYLFVSTEHADKVLDGDIGNQLGEMLESYGLKSLGLLTSGFRNIGNKKRPINSIEDLKGLKIRTPAWPMLLELLKNLGANPTPFDFNEVYLAVQTGVLDGFEVPIVTYKDMKFYEVSKYYVLDGHSYTVMNLIMNLGIFNHLTPEIQEIIMESAQEAVVYQRNTLRNEEKETLDELENDYGVVINKNPEKAPYQEAAKSIKEDFIKKHGEEAKDILNKIESIQ